MAIAATLMLFAILAYGRYLALPFIGDDYVFIDGAQRATLGDVWTSTRTDFGWWRPWSRELHFWLLVHTAGFSPLTFRLAGVALWLIGLTLYARLVLDLSGSPAVAGIATLSVGALALWGTPLLWISGSQDLWMIVFAMLSLLFFARERMVWSLVTLAGALLSKETAGVIPLLLVAYGLTLRQEGLRRSVLRAAPAFLLVIVWLFAHPVLIDRMTDRSATSSPEVEHRPSAPVLVTRTILSALNLDLVVRPDELPMTLAWGAASAVVLVAGVYVLVRRSDTSTPPNTDPSRVAQFGIAWAAIGWIPLLLPSIGWHAYYGCLGVMGAWLAVATVLVRRPAWGMIVVTSLAIVRSLHAATPSWDSGNAWYQQRAGTALSAIRSELQRLHPTLPPYSRVFLGRIPNNIGLVAGRSPALRVWYRDTTLSADFYSAYTPRSRARPGSDFFFRFDSLRTLVEVVPGPEDVAAASRANPDWADDHEKLAMLFLRSGDPRRAGHEFEKLSVLSNQATLFAGAAFDLAGDPGRADSLYRAASIRLGVPMAEIHQAAASLRHSIPRATGE